jgi:hypothetical protein
MVGFPLGIRGNGEWGVGKSFLNPSAKGLPRIQNPIKAIASAHRVKLKK